MVDTQHELNHKLFMSNRFYYLLENRGDHFSTARYNIEFAGCTFIPWLKPSGKLNVLWPSRVASVVD